MGGKHASAKFKPTAGAPAYLTPQRWTRLVETMRLPPQQAKILGLIFEGKKDKQIAAEMGLNRYTIRTYLKRMFDRFEVADRIGLVLHAVAILMQDVRE